MMRQNNKTNGFTIVELLVVIIVIGILAAITTVAYSGISQKARVATLQSDLTNTAKLMQTAYITDGVMPTSFPNGSKTTSGVGLSLSSTTNTNQFCINGQITGNGTTNYMYYDSAFGSIQTGWCSGSTIAGSELGMNKNLVKDDSFSTVASNKWGIAMSTAGGVTVTTRPGIVSDPIPNKTVMVITNNTSKTLVWAFIYGEVSYAEILNGLTYDVSYYVRKTSLYNGVIGNLSVKDGSAINATLDIGSTFTPLETWQQVSSRLVAIKNGSSLNLVYIWVPIAPFTTTGWSLEIQLPRVVLVN